MGNVSSSSFDLNSKSAVMHLLASVRVSDISTAEKNEMRDLVLAFANNTGDNSLRIALEQKIATHNILPIVLKSNVVPLPEVVLPFGSTRPAPSFATPGFASGTPPSPEIKAEVKVEEKVELVRETAPVQAPPPVAPVVSAPAPTPIAPRLNILTPKTPLREVSDLPKATERARNDQVMRPPVRPAAPTISKVADIPTSPVASAAPNLQENIQTAVVDNSKHLERIREIKAAVNERVGNPVNLVDIDNAVGREYMTALLEAMKRISGGVAGQLDQAMARLETAFKNVESVLVLHDQGIVANEKPDTIAPTVVEEANTTTIIRQPVASVPTPTPTPTPTPAPTPKPKPKPTPVSAVFKAQIPPRVIVPNAPSPVTDNPPQAEIGIGDISLQRSAIPARNSIPVRPVSGIPPRPASQRPSNHRALNIADLNEGKVVDEKSGFDDPRYQSPINNNLAPPVAPVASAYSAVPVSEMRAGVVAPSIDKSALFSTEESMDDLMSPDIEQGLDQLLSDWTLFKKSGLFGTGPKGKEHPLFKKLAPLPMPLILAGRFEGSNQDIKQSITDYMNGWRYEQGIIYEQNETFENFLRRIIRHILNLQKRQRKA